MKKNDQSSKDVALRKELKKEIDELWDKKSDGAVQFLKLCAQKYHNWKNNQIEFSDDDLKHVNIKKTIIKTVFHYHPDRQKQDKDGVFKEKDIYLRQEIVKILNALNGEIKLQE